MAIDTYEQALVHAAKHGNQTAFSELYESYYAKVYALARMTLQNDHDAEDALQAAFLKAWQSLPQLADNGAFNTWLQRITVNECYSMLRRRTPEPMEDERLYAAADDERAAELLLPEDYAQREDLRQRLWAIIQSLSQVQRQSIVLFYYDQLTVEQIAQVMDCSPGTVKSRLYLARRAIRTEIEEQERRSGQSFYGAATLPLGQLLVRELDAGALPRQTALGILQQILASAGGAVAAGAAVSASAGAFAGTAMWKIIGAIALGAAILVSAGLGIRHLTRRAEPAQTEPEPSLSLSFPDQTAPSAEPAPDPARLTQFISGTRIHIGVIFAILCLVFYYIFLSKTRAGFRTRVVGLNRDAAEFAGIDGRKYVVLAMFIAGMFSGLAGCCELLGLQGRMLQNFSP